MSLIYFVILCPFLVLSVNIYLLLTRIWEVLHLVLIRKILVSQIHLVDKLW